MYTGGDMFEVAEETSNQSTVRRQPQMIQLFRAFCQSPQHHCMHLRTLLAVDAGFLSDPCASKRLQHAWIMTNNTTTFTPRNLTTLPACMSPSLTELAFAFTGSFFRPVSVSGDLCRHTKQINTKFISQPHAYLRACWTEDRELFWSRSTHALSVIVFRVDWRFRFL